MQAPRGGAFLGKRKDREYHYPYPYPYPSASSSAPSEQAVLLQRPLPPPPPPPFARPDPRGGRPDHRPAARLVGAKPPLAPPAGAQGGAGNKLLAGYLAHEFLRRGTLLGERRLETPPLIRKEKEPAAAPELSRRYAEVSRLLMAGGARIPGVVNPSQLGRWLRIKE